MDNCYSASDSLRLPIKTRPVLHNSSLSKSRTEYLIASERFGYRSKRTNSSRPAINSSGRCTVIILICFTNLLAIFEFPLLNCLLFEDRKMNYEKDVNCLYMTRYYTDNTCEKKFYYRKKYSLLEVTS